MLLVALTTVTHPATGSKQDPDNHKQTGASEFCRFWPGIMADGKGRCIRRQARTGSHLIVRKKTVQHHEASAAT